MQRYVELIISCIVGLLSLVLSELLPSPVAKLVFIILVFVCIILFLIGQEKEHRAMQYVSGFLSVGLILVLMVCAISPEFPSQVLDRIKRHQDGVEKVPTPEELYWQDRSTRDVSLENLLGNMTSMSKTVDELSETLQSQALLSTSGDPAEVEAVLAEMEEAQEVIKSSFPAIKTDSDEVMLFYKIHLHEKIWRYSSIIAAFQKYGIDCQGLGIDEYTLLVWDVENLYNLYSMKKELEEDWGPNTFFAKKILYFNEHKMDDMNEYSDLFDYGNQNIFYEDVTAQELESKFNEYIMNYYKRFILNFSRPSNH